MQHKYFAICDLETSSCDAAVPLLEEPTPAKNLRDPEKIAEDIRTKTAEQLSRMSLDPYAGRIVCLGYTLDGVDYRVMECRDEEDERSALEEFALALKLDGFTVRHLVGFRILGFDWPWLVTRARLLGVPFPTLDTRKYGNRDITDLHSVLTFDGNIPDGAMRRSLKNLGRRFGCEVDDPFDGAQVPQMVAEGRWEDVAAHCLADLKTTYALAVAVNVVAEREPVGAPRGAGG